jgi:hypothetical protein
LYEKSLPFKDSISGLKKGGDKMKKKKKHSKKNSFFKKKRKTLWETEKIGLEEDLLDLEKYGHESLFLESDERWPYLPDDEEWHYRNMVA